MILEAAPRPPRSGYAHGPSCRPLHDNSLSLNLPHVSRLATDSITVLAAGQHIHRTPCADSGVALSNALGQTSINS